MCALGPSEGPQSSTQCASFIHHLEILAYSIIVCHQFILQGHGAAHTQLGTVPVSAIQRRSKATENPCLYFNQGDGQWAGACAFCL